VVSLDWRRFELVIFDLDGVLVATSDCHARTFDELWHKLGVEGPAYETIAGQPTAEIVSRICAPLGLSSDEIDELVRFKQERAREHLAATPVEFPDTASALARLGANLQLAVGTGASRITAELMLGHLGGAERFETVVTAQDVRRGKPDPEVYEMVLERCDVTPQRAVVVEDSALGLQAALDAQAHAVVVRGQAESDSPRFLGRFPDLTTLADAMGVPR
jgi:HAD superfamily hydrolase (TIGR01509 family)